MPAPPLPDGTQTHLTGRPNSTAIADLAFVRLASDGSTCLYNQTATHLIADVQGYLKDGAFDDVADVRLLDTRLPP